METKVIGTMTGIPLKTLEQAQRDHIVFVLNHVESMVKAAKVLDIDRRTLYRMCHRLKIVKRSLRGEHEKDLVSTVVTYE